MTCRAGGFGLSEWVGWAREGRVWREAGARAKDNRACENVLGWAGWWRFGGRSVAEAREQGGGRGGGGDGVRGLGDEDSEVGDRVVGGWGGGERETVEGGAQARGRGRGISWVWGGGRRRRVGGGGGGLAGGGEGGGAVGEDRRSRW